MAKHKFSCPTCSQHIACDENAFGRKIRCPNCKTIITVPQVAGDASLQPIPARPAGGGSTPPPPPPVRPVTAKPVGKPAIRASTIRKAEPKPEDGDDGGNGSKGPFALGVGVALILVAIIVGVMGRGGGGDGAEESTEALPLPGGAEEASKESGESRMAAGSGGMGEATGSGGSEEIAGLEPLTLEDLRFAPENTELFVAIRPFGLSGLEGIEELAASVAWFSADDVKALLDAFGVNGEQLDLAALAAVDLKLGSRFGYADRRDYLEKRIRETRSNTQRNRLQRTLDGLPKAPPPDFLGKIRFRDAVDVNVLLEACSQKETVENRGASYVKFRLPGELRKIHGGSLAVAQTDAEEVLFGKEQLVKDSLAGDREVSLSELGLNEPDLDCACLVTFVPSADAKRDLRAWAGYRFRSDDGGSLPFGEAVLNQMDTLASVFFGARGHDDGQIKIGVAVNEEGDAEETLAAVNLGLSALVKSFDRMRGELEAELADSMSEQLIGLDALGEGRRVQVALALAEGRRGPVFFSAIRDLFMASVGPQPTGTARASREPRAMAGNASPRPASTASAPPARTRPNRTLRGWTMDILHAAVTDQPVAGRVKRQAFEPDEILIENGVLILRKGPSDKPDAVLEIYNVQRVGESLDGKVYELPNVSGVNTPSVVLRWDDPTRLQPAVERYYNRFAIKLEFDKMRGGRITGRIFVALPDGEKSYLNGAFEAEVR